MDDTVLTYDYADNGELTGYSYRTLGNEVSEESIAVLRDSRGRVVQRFQDLNGDGLLIASGMQATGTRIGGSRLGPWFRIRVISFLKRCSGISRMVNLKEKSAAT